jgi:uncharacterized protein with HEPN domain
MPRDARKYLFDIAEAAKLISEFVAGKTLDDYLKSALLQSGVERQFEIIGEALGQLAKVDQQLASRITGFQKIVSFRNVLIHGYADVDDELVWDIVETRLHVLREEVEKLITDRSDKVET